jgi:hypothetical protein
MIDTQEKLDAVVKAHRVAILAVAVEAFDDSSDDDVWDTYWVTAADQIDFNIYQPEDSNLIRLVAYALRRVPDEAPYVMQVNTAIECHVADITWEV